MIGINNINSRCILCMCIYPRIILGLLPWARYAARAARQRRAGPVAGGAEGLSGGAEGEGAELGCRAAQFCQPGAEYAHTVSSITYHMHTFL